ncbi:MAG: phenylacetate--CoA ligase family protein [Burkholderiales bacterium]|nr:phenylacetate--CoA ligase family protein [Burkholderiales bacterium]
MTQVKLHRARAFVDCMMITASAAGYRFDPWNWWRHTDDLWRWGVRLRELWLEGLADEAMREALRQQRIAALLAHARSRSGFYREHYRDVAHDCTDLASHPAVTRAQLMRHFDQWVTDPALRLHELQAFIADPARVAEPYLGRYTVWTSSGTTGVPGVYVQDPDAMAVYAALLSARFEFDPNAGDPWRMMGGASRVALIAATGGHFAGVVWWERMCRIHPAVAANARVFSIMQPLAQLVAQLNDWQPVFLASYPTMLGLLAQEQRAARLRIRPRSLWSGGEGLTGADRSAIGEAFGCDVIEDYGASECMNIAFGCRHGGLHLNDTWVVLEPVDEHLRPVPPGQPSATVLLTNLANQVQPVIRYDLGDSIALGTAPCPCGARHPTLRVEGRRDDVLELQAAGRSRVRLLPLAIETVLEEEAGIARFQLTQTAPDALSLRIEARSERQRAAAFRRAAKALGRYFEQQGAPAVRLSCEAGAPQANPVSGKLRRVRALSAAQRLA